MTKWLILLLATILFATPTFAAWTDINSVSELEATPAGAEKETAKSLLIAGQMLRLDMNNKKGWSRVRDIFMFKKPISKQEALNANKAQPGLKAQEGDRLFMILGEGPSVRLDIDKVNK